jgi:hypothetical protein
MILTGHNQSLVIDVHLVECHAYLVFMSLGFLSGSQKEIPSVVDDEDH